MKYAIIGNGIAGVCAAEAIRRLDAIGSITMVGDEAFPPYSRPMISKVLDGSCSLEKLPIRAETFYGDLGITPLLGERVSRLDVEGKRIRTAENSWIPYDRLLIASGADPRTIRAEGLNLENIFTMRTEAHVRAKLKALPQARFALVLGGGLVGFKAACALLERGLKVSMLISSGYPLSMQVDETAGRMILDELVRNGLEVRVGASVTAFEGEGRVQGARTSDGKRIPCDMVVIGKGVRPAMDFVPRDKIEVDLGILVDEHMETTCRDVFAAGDVAESYDIVRKSRWINAIWPEAVAQGRTAGFNMAGRPVAYKGSLSRNVMRVLNLDVMSMGILHPPAEDGYQVLCLEDPRCRTYRRLVFRNNTLVGAVLINRIEQGGVLLSLIANEIDLRIPKETLLSPAFNYRHLL
jgi:nitrite reductase (NADH) large subunit